MCIKKICILKVQVTLVNEMKQEIRSPDYLYDKT